MLEQFGNDTMYRMKLDAWNDSFTKVYMGAIIYLIILIVLGVTGNVHVLYIYIAQFKPSKKRIFFIWLSIMDLLACSIAMPFLVVDYTYHLRYENVNVFVCKFFRFSNYLLTSGSTLILLVVAIDRYTAICRPHGRQLSNRQTQIACSAIMLFGIFIVCSPCLELYGKKIIENKDLNISAVSCEIQDHLKTEYAVYISILSCSIVGMVISFAVLYSLIFMRLRKRGRVTANNTLKRSQFTNNKTTVCDPRRIKVYVVNNDDNDDDDDNEHETTSPKVSEVKNTSLDMVINHINKQRKREKSEKRRMALILSILTSITAISWLPYVFLKIVDISFPGAFTSLTFTQHVVYHIMSLTPYFIMTNAIVYSACDHIFREELRVLYRKIFRSLATMWSYNIQKPT